MDELAITHLAAHRELVPIIEPWLVSAWPGWYGSGGPGNAREDLDAFAQRERLPVGIVAISRGHPCGLAALKADGLPSRPDLGPWASCGFVRPEVRGRGIGGRLLRALECEARAFGFARIYCGTATAQSLLRRCGWETLDTVVHDGATLHVFTRRL